MQLDRREERGEDKIDVRLQVWYYDCLVYDSQVINQGIQVILSSTDSDVTSGILHFAIRLRHPKLYFSWIVILCFQVETLSFIIQNTSHCNATLCPHSANTKSFYCAITSSKLYFSFKKGSYVLEQWIHTTNRESTNETITQQLF